MRVSQCSTNRNTMEYPVEPQRCPEGFRQGQCSTEKTHRISGIWMTYWWGYFFTIKGHFLWDKHGKTWDIHGEKQQIPKFQRFPSFMDVPSRVRTFCHVSRAHSTQEWRHGHAGLWRKGSSTGHIPWFIMAGWWYAYPSEKYESQLGWLFPICGKIKKCSKPPIRWFITIFPTAAIGYPHQT